MIGTVHCTYETPCGWCAKWDKKCDEKISKPSVKPYDYLMKTPTNQMCQSDEDHQWECCGVSTGESTYRCKICGKHKTVPVKHLDNATISTYGHNEIPTMYGKCFGCVNEDWNNPQCVDCNPANKFKHFYPKENTK